MAKQGTKYPINSWWKMKHPDKGIPQNARVKIVRGKIKKAKKSKRDEVVVEYLPPFNGAVAIQQTTSTKNLRKV